MSLSQFILFILTTAGVSFGITESNLFKRLREWTTKNKITFFEAVMNCARCNAFWVSIPVYIAIYYELYFLCYPFCASIIIYWIYQISKYTKK